MPRSTREILDHAEQLAERFEHYEPHPGDRVDATELRALRRAVTARARAERGIVEAVRAARGAGHTWSTVGVMLGTTGEAARQRYSDLVNH